MEIVNLGQDWSTPSLSFSVIPWRFVAGVDRNPYVQLLPGFGQECVFCFPPQKMDCLKIDKNRIGPN